jgi:hypothetical protein
VAESNSISFSSREWYRRLTAWAAGLAENTAGGLVRISGQHRVSPGLDGQPTLFSLWLPDFNGPGFNLEKAPARAEELFDADPKRRRLLSPTHSASGDIRKKAPVAFKPVASKMYALVRDSGGGDSREGRLPTRLLVFSG